ncbi:MAG: hypothetical protein ACI4D0_08955 [Lachnospira sp.]
MKSFLKKIVVNSRSFFQIIGVIFVGFLPSLLNVSVTVTEQPQITASQKWFDYVFYFIWTKGDKAIGLLLSIVALLAVRKVNKECIFNKGDVYKNYPYIWYWVCAKILGYSECNLILVPIFMQVKLVIHDTFDKYYCGIFSKKDNDTISVNKKNMSGVSDEVNLIIADTYPLKVEQIPASKRIKPTILISRDNSVDHNRYDSPELVQAVVNEVRNLPVNIKKINVYATTNPQNTLNIANDAFKLGERGNLDEVIVFQQRQTGNPRRFEKKGKVVYRR